MIKCVKRGDLDTKKWDQCILNARHSRVYAMSYYLDSVCADYSWMGLIYKDYEAVMPLPLNSRIPFFTRIMLPHFAQQLGVFSDQSVDAELVAEFIKAIPASFKDVYLQLNDANPVGPMKGIDIGERSNYILDFDKPYVELRANYSKNLKRNINKGARAGLSYSTLSVEEFIPFYLAHDKAEYVSPDKTARILRSLLSVLQSEKAGTIHAAIDEQQVLVAVCVTTHFKGRLTNLMAKSSNEGKEMRAMHWLINHIIEANHEAMDCLDFEGSDIPSIAEFFAYFGAKEVKYNLVKYKRFPFNLI